MNIRMLMGLSCAAIISVMGVWLSTTPAALAQDKTGAKTWVEFTADGKAKQPVGYRKWVFLGSPVTLWEEPLRNCSRS